MARQERERRYISEYMLKYYPAGNYQLNVEIGPIPQEYVDRYGMGKAIAIFRPTRPRVDAVLWTPEAYYLIEAKLRDLKAGIGDLTYYRNLISLTPDLPFYDGQPIKSRLVIPWMIDWVNQAAKASEIDIIVYHTDWADEYVKERQNYHTKEYKEARDEKMRLRRVLGVD